VAYYCEPAGVLLTGDFLFTAGCGRLFEGTAEEMWNSLERLLRLPDDTTIYCGHDYTRENLRFAQSIEPDNEKIRSRLTDLLRRGSAGEPSVPSSLLLEKQTNPFLRARESSVKAALGMPTATGSAVFAALRSCKDSF
jgi:hydroxyacylglutathione hydrolase